MKPFIQKHQGAAFYILVLIFSGILLLLQQRIAKADEYSLSLPQLAPALAVLLICILTDKDRFAQICKRIPLRKKDVVWIPVIMALALAAVTLTAGALTWMGIPYEKWDGTAIDVMVMAGGCFFEEIGWRGFLLPRLEQRYSPLTSTLIVGFLWGFWHMSFQLGAAGFLIFILTAVEMSLLMTWIYHKADGNIMLMTLWHVSVNVLNQILLTGRLTAFGFGVFAIVLAAFCGGAVLLNRELFMPHNQK